jgi:conjugative transfer signal peptidase TraF
MTVQSRPIAVIAASLVILVMLASISFVAGLRINLTPSFPLGLWRIEPLTRSVEVGDRVFICPPAVAAFDLARERGYLGCGLCPGWFSPLIKTVVALAGQHVVIDGSITVDGVRITRSSIRKADAEGRALATHAGGIVPAGKLFLFSEFAGSYDSRYFGPIPAVGVLGFAQPLLVFYP